MRKIFLLLVIYFLFLNLLSTAQSVSINNDGSFPASGAILDVKSTNKGILIPRIALTGTNDVITVPNRPASLLVYNTSITSGPQAVSEGYYYWNGSSWLRLTANDNSLFSGWSLGGNTGTSPVSNFIGTIDNNSLVFKVNNQKAGYIGVGENNNGSVFWGYQSGLNNTGQNNVGIGINALYNNTYRSGLVAIGVSALFSNTDGVNNTAIGNSSLSTNTTGYGNTAIGTQSLSKNTIGSSNTANGYEALYNNTLGSNNTANGLWALLFNSTGNNNTADGCYSLRNNISGFNNTAIGYSSLGNNSIGNYNAANGYLALNSNTTGNLNSGLGFQANVLTGNLSNATAIGANSQVDCSNCMVLGSIEGVNGATSYVNVGIGIAMPNAPLAFTNNTGRKISLYESAVNSQYGFAVEGGQLRIYSDAAAARISFGYYNSGAFTERMYLDNSSGILTVAGTSYTSDARLKKDISPLQNSLQRIIQLNGYTYHWKNEQSDNSLQTGVLAQEVQKLFPSLVKEDSKGMLSVNYSGLIPVLIESIKEQQQQIDELKKLVETLVKK